MNLKAKQNLENAELQLYYEEEPKVASTIFNFVLSAFTKKEKTVFHTIDVGTLKAGETYNVKESVALTKEGEFNVGAVLIDKEHSFESDNIVTLKITNNNLKIPNVSLPANHNEPVASINIKGTTPLLKKDGNKFITYKTLSKGSTYRVIGL